MRVSQGIPFPNIPTRWNDEERRFAQGLRDLLEMAFSRSATYPIGIVVLTSKNTKPFSFGTWEAVTTGITGVYGWKRTA